MCIIVYEECSSCRCCNKRIYRCITKLQQLNEPPCRVSYSIDKPYIYDINHKCVQCYISDSTLYDSREYIYRMSTIDEFFTTELLLKKDNIGYECKIN